MKNGYLVARLRTKEDRDATVAFLVDEPAELGELHEVPEFMLHPIDTTYYIGNGVADLVVIPLLDLGELEPGTKQQVQAQLVDRLQMRYAELHLGLIDYIKMTFPDAFLDIVKSIPKRGAGGLANMIDDHLNKAVIDLVVRAFIVGTRNG